MHVEHIIPLAAGGFSEEENLWMACALCIGYKGTQTHHMDPAAHELVPLYNPRKQSWCEHFHWSDDGVEVLGLTHCGRATIIALKLNNEFLGAGTSAVDGSGLASSGRLIVRGGRGVGALCSPLSPLRAGATGGPGGKVGA